MGAYYSHAMNPIRGAYTEHEVTPITNSKPTFDPQLGFEYQRKPLGTQMSILSVSSEIFDNYFVTFCRKEVD